MAFKDQKLIILLLTYWLNYSFCDQVVQTDLYGLKIIQNDWELIDVGWPSGDQIDVKLGERTNFYYIKNNTNELVWKLKDDFLRKINNETKIFKLTFKYWAYASNPNTYSPVTFIETKRETFPISKRYLIDYMDYWMPCDLVISLEEFSSLRIHIKLGYAEDLIAFKDFKIEYDMKRSEGKITQNNSDSLPLKNWNKYTEPPISDSPRNNIKFLYFSNECDPLNACVIKSDGIIDSELQANTVTIKEVKISFEYWTKGPGTQITISTRGITPLNQANDWTKISDSISDNKYKTFTISVKTDKSKESFAAIRSLEMTISYDVKIGNATNPKSKLFQCSDSSCQFNIDKIKWSKPNTELTQNLFYYYPENKENSLEIFVKKDLKVDDYCMNINFWSYSDAVIEISYSLKGDPNKDVLLKIKPRASEMTSFENFNLCLKDFIALNAKEFIIYIKVIKSEFTGSIQSFAFAYKEINDASNSIFSPSKLLQRMDIIDNINNFKKEWKVHALTDRISFGSNGITFSALTDTDIPASAQITSQWVEYNSAFLLIDPEYSVEVRDKTFFNAFQITPKICDWLSHCTDVIQKVEPKSELVKVYRFKFNEFKHKKYIKLVFYIEYFKPPNENSIDLSFDLKLLNFGNKCSITESSNCIPDGPVDCPSGWTGPNCKDVDNCTKKKIGNKNGHRHCKDIGKDCQNIKNDIRCDCNSGTRGDEIIWDGKGCRKIVAPILDNWSNVTGTEYLYPNATKNTLTYKIDGIDVVKNNLCFKIIYTIEKLDVSSVLLDVIYQKRDSTSTLLFSVSLFKSSSATELPFCIGDFKYNLDENFDISLKISAKSDHWTKDLFTLKEFKPDFKIKNPHPPHKFLDSWFQNEKKDAILSKQWKYLVSSPLVDVKMKSAKNDKFEILFKDDLHSEEAKALIYSDWIKMDPNFKNSENFYGIKYNSKDFNLNPTIIYENLIAQKKVPIEWKNSNEISNGNNQWISPKNPIFINENYDVFRIVFEIAYQKKPNKPDGSLELTFEKISIGDPCYQYEAELGVSYCGHGVCRAIGPMNNTCDCHSTDFAGRNCTLDICGRSVKNVNPPQTNKVYCQTMPTALTPNSAPESTENICLSDDGIKVKCKCPDEDYKWVDDENIGRCMRTGYSNEEKSFDEFIQKKETDGKWSNKNLPVINSNNRDILPFYYPKINVTEMKIQPLNIDKNNEQCFGIYYYITENAKLGLASENSKPIFLSSTKSINGIEWTPSKNEDGERICFGSFKKNSNIVSIIPALSNLEKEMIVIRFEKDKNNINNFAIHSKKKDPILLNELPYLTFYEPNQPKNYKTINKENFEPHNMWPIAMPKENWDFDTVEVIKFITDAKYQTSTLKTAYLISNWLKDVDSYDLKLKLSGKNLENLTVQFEILDELMQIKSSSDKFTDVEIKKNDQKVIKWSFDKIKNSFRVLVKVEFKVSSSSKLPALMIEKLSLGDPCINEKNEFDKCTNYQGTCTRLDPGDGMFCNCTGDWIGDECDKKNLCTNDGPTQNGKPPYKGDYYCKEIIKFGKCIQSKNDKEFRCECPTGKYWNKNRDVFSCQAHPKCVDKNCETNTQVCDEHFGNDDEAQCKCKQHYVNISKVNSTLSCIKIDPCNDQHRENSKDSHYSGPACGKNALCIADKEETGKWECICPKGFKNQGNDCIPQLCSFPGLNNCKQKCTEANIDENPHEFNCTCYASYKLKNNECELIGKCNCKPPAFCDGGENICRCPKGFIEKHDKDGKNEGCVKSDQTYTVPDSVCAGGKLNFTDNKWVCPCGENFTLNKTTNLCDRKKLCQDGGERRKLCISQNALCNSYGKEPCSCPIGKVFEGEHINNRTCISNCQKDGRDKLCSSIKAECDPSIPYKEKQISKDFCKCLPGYVGVTEGKNYICAVAKKTIEFTISLKNNFPEPMTYYTGSIEHNRFRAKREVPLIDESDPEGYINELKSKNDFNNNMNKNYSKEIESEFLSNHILDILKNILKNTNFDKEADRLLIERCEKGNDNFLNCKLTMSLINNGQDNRNLTEELRNSCIEENTKSCYFPKYDSTGGFYIISKKDSIHSTIFKPCEGSRDICQNFSHCRNDDDSQSSLHSCLCEKNEYFKRIDYDFIKIEGSAKNPKAITEICEVIDHCASNDRCPPRDKHGKCTQSIAIRNNTNKEWVAPYYCSCDENYEMSKDNKSCTDVCSQVKCNSHGKCKFRGTNGADCACEDGWGGDSCDKEYGSKAASMGGWIAGIVVLAVLVVIASGVALIFARKARNPNYNQNHPGHQMDDYTGTSYRVGQSGSSPNRGQLAHQGRDNQAFHRD